MQEEKVSVILPIYNAEKYLKKCVNSVINQTYSNLQIILVNDGSTDGSWEICQQLRTKDNRIEIYTQSNRGVSVARNKGLNVANGKWIMFVDPDDVLDNNIILELLSQVVNSSTDIVACTCYGFNRNKKYRARFFETSRNFSSNKEDLYLQLLNVSYGQSSDIFTAIGVPWGKIYRRDFLQRNHLEFDPDLRRMQDNIFNMFAFYYANDIIYVDKPLYYYRLSNIQNYNNKHLSELNSIFLPVIKSRYYGLKRLCLFNHSRIYEGYINEAATIFVELARGEFFTASNKQRANKYMRTLMKQPYFKDVFSKKNKKLIKSKKTKLKLYLIEHNMYYAYIIYKKMIKNYLVK